MTQFPYPTDPVSIILADGVERHLRFTLRSMRNLKAKFGASILAGGGLLQLDEDKLPALIAEGLTDKSLSADEIEDLIDARSLPYVAGQVALAFSGGQPEKKQEDDRPTEAAPETVAAIQ